jgi:hypothetical protein
MDVAELGIRVDASGAITVLDKFGHKVDEVAGKTNKLEETLKSAAEAFAAMEFGKKLLEETVAAQDAMTDLASAVAATGGGAGKTTAELARLADEIQETTRFSHVAAEQAEALALSFTNIRGDQMKEVLEIATNLATRLKMDLVSAMDMVGRALQDPARGLTLLQRSLRLFTEDQIKAIQLMAETGDTAGAQAAILSALEARYNGAAAAAKGNLGGALATLKNDFNDLFQVSASGAAPVNNLLHEIDAVVVMLKPHMDTLVAALEAGTVAWIAYKAAMASVAVVQAIVAAGALDIVAVVAAIVALTAGFLVFKKIMADTRAELEKFAGKTLENDAQLRKALGIDKPDTPPPGTLNSSRAADLRAQNEARVRSAKDELELAKAELDIYGSQSDMLDKIKNKQDRINQDKDAELQFQKGMINEQEKAAAQAANKQAEAIRNQAADLRFIKSQLDNIWSNLETSSSNFFRNLLENGKSSAKQLGQSIKDAVLGALADILAHKLMSTFLQILTGNENRDLGKEQMEAGALMLQAAKMMKDAANTIATGVPTSSDGGSSAPGGAGGGAPGGMSSSQKLLLASGALFAGYNAGNAIGSGGYGNPGLRVLGGTLSGAAQGAAIGATVGGPVGALVGGIVGGVSGLVGSIVGLGSAAKRHREEIKALAKEYEAFTDNLKVQAGLMTSTDYQIKQLIDQVDAEIKKQETSKGRPYNDASKQAIAELNRLEALRIQQLREDAALTLKLTKDSIEARRLRALGNNLEADALDLKIQHEKEYADAVRQGLDATTLAQLKYVQSLEEQKAAADAFTSSALNIPEGYKVATALFQALDPEQPGAGPLDDPFGGHLPGGTDNGTGMPKFPNRGTSGGGTGISPDTPININLDGKVIANSTLGVLQRAATRQYGDATRIFDVTEV